VKAFRVSGSLTIVTLALLAAACGSSTDDTGNPPVVSGGGAQSAAGSPGTAGSGSPNGGATSPGGGAPATNAGAGGAPTTGAGAGGAPATNAGAGGTPTTNGGSGTAGGSNGAGGSPSTAGAGGAVTGGAGAGPVSHEIWVSPDGKDTNPGTVDAPMLTVCDSVAKVGACYKLCPGSYTCPATGGTIWLKGGIYKITKKIDIGAIRPGVAGGIMNLFAVAGQKPIIDASGLDTADVTKTGIGIHLKASYWHLKGIEVMNAPHNCIKVEGGYNTVENMVVHKCGNTGITISAYDGTDMSAGPGSNNTILNCDSWGNVGIDGRGEDADGFGAKEQAGKNNLFKFCRSWNNADDGFDFYGWGDPITVQGCWAFENAKMKAPGGDGNGFKLGKGPGAHIVKDAISAYNVATAYTSNGADKLSTCTNCKQCSNGSVTGSGDHGISGTIATMSPCADLKKGEGARNADGSLPTL
jgi:Right handed beta helix region